MEQISDLLLMGVGGGGCALIRSIVAQANVAIKTLGVDTDASSRSETEFDNCDFLLIGGARFSGHGTGGDAVNGRLAVQDDFRNLDPYLEGVRMVVVVTALGAGTGGGATPEILKYCHECGITTLCFATTPFVFEGPSRTAAALRSLSLIESCADTLVALPLDDLHCCQSGNDQLQLSHDRVLEILGSGISLMWRMLCLPGYINLDVERLRSMVVGGKRARLGFALSEDVMERAGQVVEQFRGCKLLHDSSGKVVAAEALLVGIVAGDDLRLSEITVLMRGIQKLFPKSLRVEMGTVQDPAFNGRIEVVLFAFDKVLRPPDGNALGPGGAVAAKLPPVADTLPVALAPRRAKGKSKGRSKLSFGPTGRGKFQNSEPTIYEGVDLDVPSYIRYGINIEK
ncbi:MAG: hypothetical protein PHO37_14385 [Kiritimatiellae bacterium]|nr:hypothetical protein [Kiritimatiellia bacterium]